MKFIKSYENHNNINESVIMVGDGVYRVKAGVDITQSVINSYVKKVKTETGKDLRQYYSDMEIAEELVKLSTANASDVENIDSRAMIGGQAQAQTQAQVQTQDEVQVQTQDDVQAQAQVQTQDEFDDEFIDNDGQGQAQAQVQTQADESQEEVEDEFEDTQAEDEEEEDLDNLDDLPL